MVQLEVGKRYLDDTGAEWEIIRPCLIIPGAFQAAPSAVLASGHAWLLSSFTAYGLGIRNASVNLVAEVNFTPTFNVEEVQAATDLVFASIPAPLKQCSCPTVVLMRDGCKCGHARKEIEQEFKQRGWK